MFIGYENDRPGDTMIMVDPKNNYQAFYTRDVTWLKRNYFQPGPEKKNGRVLHIIGVNWPDEHDEPESETQNHFFQRHDDDDPDDNPTAPMDRVVTILITLSRVVSMHIITLEIQTKIQHPQIKQTNLLLYLQ